MANSRFEYVREFETDDRILPNCWIVVRIDGKAFHKFTEKHNFEKPNDQNGLNLMNYAAMKVMQDFNEIVIAFGQSDEYSFVFHKTADVYNRLASKILTCMNTHINNLYNTVFWKLVLEGGRTNTQAQEDLSGTFSADKNEILFSKFGINYNNLPQMYRKGTILIKKMVAVPELKNKRYPMIVPLFVDMIQDEFWQKHKEILTRQQSQDFDLNDELVSNLLIKLQISVLLKRKSNQ